jgi:hypothetical protein
MLAGRVGDLLPDHPGLGAGDPGGRVDDQATHAVGLDQERVGQVTQRAGVVPGALGGDPRAAVPGETDRVYDVLGRSGYRDRRGLLVHGQVPGLPGVFPAGIGASEDGCRPSLSVRPAVAPGAVGCDAHHVSSAPIGALRCRSCAPTGAMPSASWPIRGMIRCSRPATGGWLRGAEVVSRDPARQLGARVQAELGQDVRHVRLDRRHRDEQGRRYRRVRQPVGHQPGHL